MENKINTDYKIVETGSELEKRLLALDGEKRIAVDLEADSMYHFREKVCLIQLATKHDSIVIDSLKVKDLSLLKPLFSSHDILKIFHGADYDVRSLFRDFKIVVQNLFDTELASRFLGIRETGLDAVLQQKFNIHLDKKYQRKDWSKRPLPDSMVTYAAKDVAYLVSLAIMLEDELEKKGRLAWVQEECEYLSQVRPAPSNSNPLFLKCKGAGKLNHRDLAVLEELLRFRMRFAAQKDRPLYKIVSNTSLMKIAVARPENLKQLKESNILSDKQINMYGKSIISAIIKSMKVDNKKFPRYPNKRAPSLKPDAVKKLKALKKWRNGTAKNLQMDPSLLFNKTVLTAIAVKNPFSMGNLGAIKEIRNWQQNEFGGDIMVVLKNIDSKRKR